MTERHKTVVVEVKIDQRDLERMVRSAVKTSTPSTMTCWTRRWRLRRDPAQPWPTCWA